MNASAAFLLAFAFLAAFGSSVAWRLSRAPIWSGLGRFAAVAAATAAYQGLEVLALVSIPSALRPLLERLICATVVLVTLAWLRYSDVLCRRVAGSLERRLRGALVVAAATMLVPGLAVDTSRELTTRDQLFGEAWRFAALTPYGAALCGVLLLFALLVELRLLLAWRAGDRRAGALGLFFALALPFGFSDTLIHAAIVNGPHLLGFALAVPLAGAAWLVGTQFVADAGSLQELRMRLEGLVEERTRELAEAHAALLQAEKLAALGQFAAGVAHEVNNPASVVTSNLSWLSNGIPGGLAPEAAKEVVDESLDAMQRINELVRKLLDAGRLADLPPGAGNVALSHAVERAFSELRSQDQARVELVNRVPDDLIVRGGDLVGRIVANLVQNGIEAIPVGCKGRVEASARVDGQIVRLVIDDDGAGMSVDVLRRAFDPFFTTKPTGRGSGLGLPITRGLVEGIGGEIWLESEPGKGTRAAVELPAGTPA